MPLEHSLISSSFHCLVDETKAIQLRQSNSNDIIEDKTFVSIVGCMRQLSTLAEYSNGLFIELVQLAGKTNERIETLRRRSQSISESLVSPVVLDSAKRIKRPSIVVKSAMKFDFHVMSHENLPIQLKKRYALPSMRKVPPLDELHIFKSHLGSADVSIMYSRRYSHPGYFLQQWCMAQEARIKAIEVDRSLQRVNKDIAKLKRDRFHLEDNNNNRKRSGVARSRKKFSDWTRVALRMLYLRKMMLEVTMQQQKEAADSDDEVDVLDPSLYATPRPVEFDKSSQKNPSYLSPNVLISVEEINAIITASPQPQPQPQQHIHLKEAASSSLPPLRHDKQIDREEESAGQAQPAEAISSFQRVYGRMRASILPADTARQRSITDGHTAAEAETLFSGSIWRLLNLLPGVSKRAGGSGGVGGGAGGGKSAVSEDRIVLTTYSTELEDLSKFYTATNPEEFSVTTTELRRHHVRSNHLNSFITDQMMKSIQPVVLKSGSTGGSSTAPSTTTTTSLLLLSRTVSESSSSVLTTHTRASSHTHTHTHTNSAMSSCHTSNDNNDADSDRHAISIVMKMATGADLTTTPKPHVYMILERGWQLDNEESDSDSEERSVWH